MKNFARVVGVDRKRIFRDPFLLMMTVLPVVFGLLLRNFLPEIRSSLIAKFDLQDYYPIIVCLFVATPALYIGAVLALQLIEEQENNMVSAIRTTPFTLRRYVGMRLVGYTCFSAILIFSVQFLIGISTPPFGYAGILAVVFSLQVPIISLGIARFSDDQVEGMVALKVAGFTVLPALAMFFVADYWHLLAGVLPAYWPIIGFLVAVRPVPHDGFFIIAMGVGLIYQLLLVRWLFISFNRKFERAP